MINKMRFGAALLIVIFMLSGCSQTPKNAASDPKTEAENQLLNEIGIQKDDIKKRQDSNDLPTVSPSPPSLPATDADPGVSSAPTD